MTKHSLKHVIFIVPVLCSNNPVVASQYKTDTCTYGSVISSNLPFCSQFTRTFNNDIKSNINPNVQIFKPQTSVKKQGACPPILLGAKSEDNTQNLTFTEFFKKYPNPEFLVIVECDGITQTIQALNAEKAIVNNYYSQCENCDLVNKVDKWIGISYGNVVSGANVGTLVHNKNVDEFNTNINSIISFLEKNRANQYKWYSPITNCIFNSCLKCVKLSMTSENLEKIRASQFDQINSKATKQYITKYFPKKMSERLICLRDGADRKRIDPDYQSSYVAVINKVNNIATSNNKNVMKKNFSGATNIASTILDTINVPVAGLIIKKAGELAGKDLDFKAIENTKNCSSYKEMLDEILECGTFKLIINVDNYDGEVVSPDIQVEYKPLCNKLKYRLTINIPSTLYQDKSYSFNDGYDKIMSYLNRESISYFTSPIYDFINKIDKSKK